MSSNPLFKDREKFTKRQADATNFLVANEKRQKLDKPSSQKANRPKTTMNRSKTSSDFLPTLSTSAPRNLKLTNVVEALKERYLSGQTDPVTLDELIKECNLSIDESDRHWLLSEALLSNQQVDVKQTDESTKFVYKPPLDLKGAKRSHLLNLIKSRHEKCETAVTVDEVRETLPQLKADKFIANLIENGDAVKVMNSSKKEVLFYADRDNNLNVNKEFIESWRKTSVEGLDDKKLFEYINSHGHYGLKKDTPQHTQISKKPKNVRRHVNAMKHNEHVADQLIDFSNIPSNK